MIVAKYKFNPNTYSDYLPVFNSGFSYTKSDVNNSDGTITRTINSDSLPTVMKFGDGSSSTRASSLLEILDMNTSNLTTMDSMFRYCDNLTNILCDWDTSKVTIMSNAFQSCSKLTSLDLNNWDTSKVTSMYYAFDSCSSLTSLDISNWDTSNVTNIGYTFHGCSSLTSLDLSKWDTSQVNNTSYMFNSCSSLTSLDISNWDTSKVTNTSYMFNSCGSLYKVNLKYANEFTVSKIHEQLLNRSSTTKGYILSSVDLTSNKNWQIIKSSHNNFYLPQPLRKIGDVKDRLYWDEDKGHYCIEQNIGNIILNGSEDWVAQSSICTDICYMAYLCILDSPLNTKLTYLNDKLVKLGSNYTEKIDKEGIYTSWGGLYINVFNTRLYSIDIIGFKQWLSENPITVCYVLPQPNIIDLPYLNQKFTFDSYNPSTTIDIPNRPLKASKTYLDAPIARYRYTNLQPNTQYNVQFDCKGDSGIKVNLGGTEVTFTPTSNWTRKNLTITTPSELVNDKLSISNVGITSNNKIDNVMLFSEVIAQEPDYIDAIQSVGELQSNGTYKIGILTHNGVKNLVNTNPNNWIEKDSDSVIVKSSIKTEKGKAYTVFNSMGQWVAIYESDLDGNQYNLIKQDNIGNWSFIATSEYIKVSLWDISHISDKLSQPHNMNVRIFEGYNDYGYNGYEERKLSTQSIYLPQPLRKIGNIKDKLYWDYDKGHYCIEQNVDKVILDGSEDEDWNISGEPSIDRINTMVFRVSNPMIGSVYNIKCDKFITCSIENNCYDTDNEGVVGVGGEPYYLCLGIKKSKLPTQDVAGFRQWLQANPTTVLYVLETPIIIDLPEMNKKFSFDTYLPNTSVDVTNLPLQPYGLLLEDDTVRYKSTIEPSTLYTIQFNCIAKSTTNLTLDLGGSRKTVDPIIGVNHVQITTPSELTSDRLFLIGTGIVVKEVIVNKGNMVQYPKYFDGEQSVGELQTDGTYKIVIKTNEGFTVTIRTSSPLTKLDKVYWNNIDKRYEIDRNGVIEVPTVEGDIVDLPRLYQKVDTTINISTDNIEPSKIEMEYNDINNN